MDIINRAQKIKVDQTTEDAKKRELFTQNEDKTRVRRQESDANIVEFIQLMEKNSIEKTELYEEFYDKNKRRYRLLGYGWILHPYDYGDQNAERSSEVGIFLLSDGRTELFQPIDIKIGLFSKYMRKNCKSGYVSSFSTSYFSSERGINLLATAIVRYGIV